MAQYFLSLHNAFTVIPFLVALARGYRHLNPTSLFAGLRAAQIDIEVRPTANPWSPSEILRRLSGDPGICGWVEGNSNNTVSCNSGYTCAATSTFVGCCSTGAAGCEALYTTCYDSQGTPCKGACQLNSAALICAGQFQYCATYRYASGSQGYGCAAVRGYDKTVLTTTTPGATPFGQPASTTSASRTTTPTSAIMDETSTTQAQPSATSSPMNMTSISGGAIAGAVAGSVLALVAIISVVLFLRRKRRIKKRRGGQAASQISGQDSRRYSDRFVYAQYAKPDQAFSSPAQSPPMHSRQPSDTIDMFGSSPPQSELGGRPLSPASVSPTMGPVELEVTDGERYKQQH